MKKYIKKILPEMFLNNYQLFKREIDFLKNHKNLLEDNKELKNSKIGKTAFLLATGPSIKKENLKVLKNQDCFTVSNFFLHEDINLLKPLFHFFAPYHKPLILENFIEWLNISDEKLPKNTKIFLSTSSYNMVKDFNLFRKREIKYLYLSSDKKDFSNIDIQKPVQAPFSVPLMVLPVLFYMGYEKIYLLGCDHNTLKDYNKTVEHFYDRNKDIRVNAADDLVWKNNSNESNIINLLESEIKLFLQYKFYRNISNKNNKPKIINLSKDSWLDLFPFDSLDKINL